MSTSRPAGVVANQAAIFLRLWRDLHPHVRRDRNLPARLQQRLSRERAFGSRDRRLYRELLYTAIRYLPWVETAGDDATLALVAHFAAETPATRAFRSALGRAPAIERTPEELLPAWLREECAAAFEPAQLDALLARAPLWLRLQTDTPATVATEFAARGWSYTPSTLLPGAWRVDGEVDVTQSEAYARGQIEIQDLGSQLILESIGLTATSAAGARWFDACAGAGGKTLQLARLLGPSGHVTAHDIRPSALEELQVRAARAGLSSRITLTTVPAGEFDGVLVDAPCSGSGTWRRAPHLKWTTTPADIAAHAELQRELLARFARHVRPGGRLVYATCSLCRSENESVVETFLANHPEFAPAGFARTYGGKANGAGLPILPAAHDTDGFFVASLRRGAA